MYQINYNGGIIAAQCFDTKEGRDNELKSISDYREKWEEIRAEVSGLGLSFKAGFGAFCPYLQLIRVSFLAQNDEPAIPENGMYIDFKVNMKEGKIEVTQYGHIYLTKADSKKSYLCMCGLRNCVQHSGGKWFRKQAYKTPGDLAEKVRAFYSICKKALDENTTGYPYKQMAVDIY